MKRHLRTWLVVLLCALAGNAVAGAALEGSVPPAFTLPDLDGQSHTLSEWHGKIRVVNFLASWCPTCQYEMPDLVRWQQQFRAHGLQIVAVAVDEARPMQNFARTFDVNFPILLSHPQRSEDLLKGWGNDKQLLPYTVVLDASGRVIYRQHGTFDQETFDDIVRPLLARR